MANPRRDLHTKLIAREIEKKQQQQQQKKQNKKQNKNYKARKLLNKRKPL